MNAALENLPTPGEVDGLALGVASAGELETYRPHPHEARLAAGMQARRRRDFLVGRLAARRALQALAVPAAAISVAGGRPLFPPPAVGSVSHSCGVGVALAGLGVSSVGVDIELRRISLRAARGICTPGELAWALSAASKAERAERATALFSAKESAYKALPARAQSSLRWRDIAISPGGSGFTAVVQGEAIAGRWWLGHGILTWVTRPGPGFVPGEGAI